jgi:hypothetical protein
MFASARAAPEDDLRRAEDLFFVEANPEDALIAVSGVLGGEATDEVRHRALILRGRCLLALRPPQEREADEAFCSAVKIDPAWIEDVDFRDAERRTYRLALARCKPPLPVPVPPDTTDSDTGSIVGKPVFYVPAGVAVGTILYFVFKPDEDDPGAAGTAPTAGFPDPPTR